MSDEYVIIQGELPHQDLLRPRNWADRFTGNLASYGPDRRPHCAPAGADDDQ